MISIIMLLSLGGCKNDEVIYMDPADNKPPSVLIAYPYNDAVLSDTAIIRVLATDEGGIKKIILYVDGLQIPDGESVKEPYEIPWNTFDHKDSSAHTLVARAYDKYDNIADSDPVKCFIDNKDYYPGMIEIYPIIYDDGSFEISWEECSDANFTSYTLYESSNAQLTDEHQIYNTGEVTDTVFVVSGIGPGDEFFYRLKVENALGLTNYSQVRKAISPAGFPDGLKAYYPFNGNANDESGFEHHGVVNNTILTSDRFGNPGSAYEFDANKYIEIPDHEDIVFPDGFTVAAWIYPVETRDHNNIVSLVNPNRDFVVQLTSENKLNAHFFADPDHYHINSTKPVPLNEWSHVAYTYIDKTMKIYINGMLDNTYVTAGAPLWTGTVMLIGAMNYEENFFGSIDEVMIFGRALSDEEVMLLLTIN